MRVYESTHPFMKHSVIDQFPVLEMIQACDLLQPGKGCSSHIAGSPAIGKCMSALHAEGPKGVNGLRSPMSLACRYMKTRSAGGMPPSLASSGSSARFISSDPALPLFA